MQHLFKVESDNDYIIESMNETDNFISIYSEILRFKNISWRAKGIYFYLASISRNRDIKQSELQKMSTEGRDAFNNAFNELIEKGYLKVFEYRDDNGKFMKKKFKLVWSILKNNPFTENPQPFTENPQTVKNVNSRNVADLSVLPTKNQENFFIDHREILNYNNIYKYKYNNIYNNIKESIDNTETKNIRFIKPDIEQVRKEFTNRGSTELEADSFFYFYDSKDWYVGNHKMKRWKSAVAGWITRKKSNKKQEEIDNVDLSQYDWAK